MDRAGMGNHGRQMQHRTNGRTKKGKANSSQEVCKKCDWRLVEGQLLMEVELQDSKTSGDTTFVSSQQDPLYTDRRYDVPERNRAHAALMSPWEERTAAALERQSVKPLHCKDCRRRRVLRRDLRRSSMDCTLQGSGEWSWR
jgi:hypothetical protein